MDENEILKAIKEGFSSLKKEEIKKEEENILINTLTTGFNELKELLKPKEIEAEIIEDEKIEIPEIPEIIEEVKPKPNRLGEMLRKVLIG